MVMPLIPAIEAEAGRSLVKSSRSAWSTEALVSRKKKRKKANTDCMPKLKRDWKKIKHLWVSGLLNHESSFIPFLKILFNVVIMFFYNK